MANGRVQVQGVGSAPKLQAVVNAGGQYRVQTQQAGRNKLMDLADALSQVNPILKDFTIARQIERDMSIKEGEQYFTENPEDALLNLNAGLGKTKREIRKLADQGILDERSNPDFLLGIRAARAKSLAKNDLRRSLLTNADALNAEDPVAYAQQAVADFYENDIFQESQFAKNSVRPVLDSIVNEYVGTVTNRQQQQAVDQGKTDWLDSVLDDTKAWANDAKKLDDDDTFTDWLNDGAGSFKGSKSYALTHLFRPVLMDLAEQGDVTGALIKLEELKKWKVNKETGAKFVNASLNSAINALETEIINRSTAFRSYAVNAYNNRLKDVTSTFESEYYKKLNDQELITDAFQNDFNTRVRTAVAENGLAPKDGEDLIARMREEANKLYNRQDEADERTSDPDVLALLKNQINRGEDAETAIKANRDSLSQDDFVRLLDDNGKAVDFDKNVMSLPAIKNITESIELEFKGYTSGGMSLSGLGSSKQNFVTQLVDPDESVLFDGVPQYTKTILAQQALKMWRTAMFNKRNSLITAKPDITPDALNRELSNRAADMYETARGVIEEDVVNRLQSGQYDLGLTKKQLEEYRDGTDLNKLPKLMKNLGIEKTDVASMTAFINNYHSNHF